MNITIIGSGYVGLVTGVCLSDAGHKVICVDKDKSKIANLSRGQIPIYEPGLETLVKKNIKEENLSFSSNIKSSLNASKIIFIAVGTPTSLEGDNADLSQIYSCAKEISESLQDESIIIVKSTVPVGTCDKIEEIISKKNPNKKFEVISNPEFLREGSAISDFENPDRIVVGTSSKKAIKSIKEIYKRQIEEEYPIIFTSRKSSELIKYASNSMLAMRIIFINEIADLCEKVGANVEDIANGIGLDKRIGPHFLNAGPGFGGSCFPKDARALIESGEEFKAPQNLLKAVIDGNERRKLNLGDRILEVIGENKKVGILGVTFKANTDDMREAPSLSIIPKLLKKNINVSIYDPEANKENINEFYGAEWKDDAYSVAKNSDCLIILTEWNEFKELDLKKIKDIMTRPIIVDFRNIFSLKEMEDLNFEYHSVGRNTINTK
jgi:UDPglucose 6-dehydrogenase